MLLSFSGSDGNFGRRIAGVTAAVGGSGAEVEIIEEIASGLQSLLVVVSEGETKGGMRGRGGEREEGKTARQV